MTNPNPGDTPKTACKGEPDTGLSARNFDLIEVALDSAAQSVQSGATLRNKRGLDPLAREYLEALDAIQRLRARTIPDEEKL